MGFQPRFFSTSPCKRATTSTTLFTNSRTPKQNYYVLSGIMKFCIESTVMDAAVSTEQHISKWIYEITEVQEIYISRLELQRWSLEFVISFSKVYILDWGLANSLWDHVIQISTRLMNFQYIFLPNYEKLNLFWKHLLPIIKYLLSRNSYVCPIWLLYLTLTRPELTEKKYNVHVCYSVIEF